ncbi:AMP-binding protein [Rhodococcus sp. NPDC003994]
MAHRPHLELRGECAVTARTLAALLDDLVTLDPAAPALYDVTDGGVVVIDRAALRARVEVLTDELRRAGVTGGHCIAVHLPNWSDTVVWQFAAASVGAHVIGVNTRYNSGEIAHILTSARPAVVAIAPNFHDLDLLGRLRTALDAVEIPAPVLAVVPGPSASAPQDISTFDVGAGCWTAESGVVDTLRTPPPVDTAAFTAAGRRGTSADRLAVAFTTSGSTGTPKLAAHRESAVVAHAVADALGMGVRPGDVALCVLPLSGVFGFSTAMAALAGGGAVLMESVFDADAVVRRMAAVGVTHAVGGDDLMGRIHDVWQEQNPRSDLGALRWIGIADFLGRSHALATWARESFGTVTTGVFGSSEVFALLLFWHQVDPDHVRWNGGGRPVSDDIAVRIVDPVDDTPVPVGSRGEIQVWGPTVVDAYLGNPEAAARAFTDDGWFRSGDLGIATGDGGVTYVCRMGDALRLRGFLVDPAEIEHRLADHPDVVTAKVVGIDGRGGYTEAVAFVVPGPGATATATEFKRWCGDELAAFKVPSAVHVIERMPTTVGGNGSKIRAVELREWARQWIDEERDCRHVAPARH